MTFLDTLRAVGLAAILAVPAAAQDTDELTTADEVRSEAEALAEAVRARAAD